LLHHYIVAPSRASTYVSLGCVQCKLAPLSDAQQNTLWYMGSIIATFGEY
jgi:hypothetical protein